MRIVADENIVALDTYSEFGELIKLPGRKISAADVRDADALIVRSITTVNKTLLEGSRVQFVATATSGTNHLNLDWLADAGIAVADAAGCNADAVVEYVFSSICELIRSGRFSLRDKTFAVIGAGHVGGRLLRLLQRLGVRCLACDPFLEEGLKSREEQSEFEFCTLEEALRADIISVHTPLTYTGDHPTFHLFNAERLAALKPGTLLINAARGEIVDNAALLAHLRGFSMGAAHAVQALDWQGLDVPTQTRRLLTIFDVWEAEPTVSPALAALIDIATPHIAGYSIEAKLSASRTNFHSFMKHFQLTSTAPLLESDLEKRALVLPAGLSWKDIVSVDGSGKDGSKDGSDKDSNKNVQVAEAVCNAFRVMELSNEFKSGIGTKNGDALFDELRKKLSLRHEFGLRYSV